MLDNNLLSVGEMVAQNTDLFLSWHSLFRIYKGARTATTTIMTFISAIIMTLIHLLLFQTFHFIFHNFFIGLFKPYLISLDINNNESRRINHD